VIKNFVLQSAKITITLISRKATAVAVKEIDKKLHRNRSILLEILGKHKTQNKIPRIELEKRKFSFKYHTHININSAGKTYYFLYDIAWMEFSNDEVLIIRRNRR
jgi:hypothetical protein